MSNLVKWINTTFTPYEQLVTKDQNTIYFLSDTRQIYKGDTLYTSSIIFYNGVLPATGIEGKLYIDSITFDTYVWNLTAWILLSSKGTNTSSLDIKLDTLFNLKNKSDAYTYNTDGNITKIQTTGDVTEVTDYEYDLKGNVSKETIQRQGSIIVNTFVYDDMENIAETITTVN